MSTQILGKTISLRSACPGAECVNTVGSYKCKCKDGFKVSTGLVDDFSILLIFWRKMRRYQRMRKWTSYVQKCRPEMRQYAWLFQGKDPKEFSGFWWFFSVFARQDTSEAVNSASSPSAPLFAIFRSLTSLPVLPASASKSKFYF